MILVQSTKSNFWYLIVSVLLLFVLPVLQSQLALKDVFVPNEKDHLITSLIGKISKLDELKSSKSTINWRYKRQALVTDDDDVDDVSSNVTESPVHRVSSDGGVQITIDLSKFYYLIPIIYKLTTNNY